MLRFWWEPLKVSNTRMTNVVFPTLYEYPKPEP
jgi:hypothetical protein